VDCEICHGSRWKSVTVDGIERLTRCDCWRSEVVDRLLKEARVPARYARCELATFEHDMNTQREAFRRATRFVEAFPAVDKGLLLYGPHGVGKTHLAVGILKEVVRKKGARGYFFETRELLKLVRETYTRTSDDTEMDVLAPVLEADLLVLDDLGAEKTSEWVQETLGLVVNTRYNARRATIFTSNLVDSPDNTDPQGFIFQLGARTRSRLVEMCDWVEIQGADVREVGPHATAEKIAEWQKKSPASPQNVKKSSGLPPRTKGMARAKLRDSGLQYELNWSGGKAGSK
jgi:DNA replication protein DnaC